MKKTLGEVVTMNENNEVSVEVVLAEDLENSDAMSDDSDE